MALARALTRFKGGIHIVVIIVQQGLQYLQSVSQSRHFLGLVQAMRQDSNKSECLWICPLRIRVASSTTRCQSTGESLDNCLQLAHFGNQLFIFRFVFGIFSAGVVVGDRHPMPSCKSCSSILPISVQQGAELLALAASPDRQQKGGRDLVRSCRPPHTGRCQVGQVPTHLSVHGYCFRQGPFHHSTGHKSPIAPVSPAAEKLACDRWIYG